MLKSQKKTAAALNEFNSATNSKSSFNRQSNKNLTQGINQ
jgi:hypothetical protein